MDTSLAEEEILARSELSGVVVPSNIAPSVFAQVEGDNDDIRGDSGREEHNPRHYNGSLPTRSVWPYFSAYSLCRPLSEKTIS